MCGDSLQTLTLGRNRLGVDEMFSQSVGLKNCKQLVRLDISGNVIGSHGLLPLAEALQLVLTYRY